MSRTKASFKNFIWANISFFITVLLNFVLRTILIKTLGEQYVGINSLFANVLNILSLAELGIGSAISFSLYKPLAENDEKTVKALINFYRNAYRIVAVIVFFIGVCLIPVLPYIAKGSEGIEHLTFIYCVYLFNTVSSYLITYKSTIITADQKGYILSNINLVGNVSLIIIQIVVLLLWKNYVYFIVVAAVIGLIKNVYINYASEKNYPYLKGKNTEILSKDERKTIFTKIKALLYHRIGQVVVSQTDSVITSSFINVSMVGFVSNYNMIINVIKNVAASVFEAVTPSIGNLIVLSDKEHQYKTYKNIEFIGFWINYFTSLCLFFLLTPFIRIWIGQHFVLDELLIFLLVINYYIYISRLPMLTIRNASGNFEPDRLSPIFESIINLVVSIVLAKMIGITGVYIGTLVSSIVPVIWCPIIVCKFVFNRSSKQYFIRQIYWIALLIISGLALRFIFNLFTFNNNMIEMLFRGVILLIIPNLIITILYFRSDEYQYAIRILNGLIRKVFKRK